MGAAKFYFHQLLTCYEQGIENAVDANSHHYVIFE